MERTDRAQGRPLVVRFGAMGDMVIALTLIEALHRRFGTPVDTPAGLDDLRVPPVVVQPAWREERTAAAG